MRHFSRASMLSGLAVVVLGGLGCVGLHDDRNQERSLEAVQAVCVQADPTTVKDGWGADLVIRTDGSLGVLVISLGRDGKPDRPIAEYWDPRICGMTSALDKDIVCVNGRMRRWPEFNKELVRLPFDCEMRMAPESIER